MSSFCGVLNLERAHFLREKTCEIPGQEQGSAIKFDILYENFYPQCFVQEALYAIKRVRKRRKKAKFVSRLLQETLINGGTNLRWLYVA